MTCGDGGAITVTSLLFANIYVLLSESVTIYFLLNNTDVCFIVIPVWVCFVQHVLRLGILLVIKINCPYTLVDYKIYLISKLVFTLALAVVIDMQAGFAYPYKEELCHISDNTYVRIPCFLRYVRDNTFLSFFGIVSWSRFINEGFFRVNVLTSFIRKLCELKECG